MKVKSPQDEAFVRSKQRYRLYCVSMIGSFVLAVFNAVFITQINIVLPGFVEALAVFLIIAMFVSKCLYEKSHSEASNVLINGLIDNSFGTKLAETESENYYDTDTMEKDEMKLLANIHESAMYTFEITRKMRTRMAIIVFICILPILFVWFSGLTNSAVFSLAMEVFLSAQLAGRLYSIHNLTIMSQRVVQDACSLWVQSKKINLLMLQPHILEIFLRYEIGLAGAKIILNEKIYKKLSPVLEKKWAEAIGRYEIIE